MDKWGSHTLQYDVTNARVVNATLDLMRDFDYDYGDPDFNNDSNGDTILTNDDTRSGHIWAGDHDITINVNLFVNLDLLNVTELTVSGTVGAGNGGVYIGDNYVENRGSRVTLGTANIGGTLVVNTGNLTVEGDVIIRANSDMSSAYRHVTTEGRDAADRNHAAFYYWGMESTGGSVTGLFVGGGGSASIGGDLEVGRYNPGFNNPTRPTVGINGNITLSGAGSSLQVGGDATATNDVIIGEATTMSVGGDLAVWNNITTAGFLDVGGDIYAIPVSGDGFPFRGPTLTITGVTHVTGDVHYTTINVNGGKLRGGSTYGYSMSELVAPQITNTGIIEDFSSIYAYNFSSTGILHNIGTLYLSEFVNRDGAIVANIGITTSTASSGRGIFVSSSFVNNGLVASVDTISDRFTIPSSPTRVDADTLSWLSETAGGGVTMENYGGTIRDVNLIDMWRIINVGRYMAGSDDVYYGALTDFARIVDVRRIITVNDVINQGTGAIIDGHPIAYNPDAIGDLSPNDKEFNGNRTGHGLHGNVPEISHMAWRYSSGGASYEVTTPPAGADPNDPTTWPPGYSYVKVIDQPGGPGLTANNALEGGYHYEDGCFYYADGSMYGYNHTHPLEPSLVGISNRVMHIGRDLLNLDEALVCNYTIEVERDVYNIASRISVGSYEIIVVGNKPSLYQTGTMAVGRDLFNLSQKQGGPNRDLTQYSVIENFRVLAVHGNVINGENAIITAGLTDIDPLKDANNMSLTALKYTPSSMLDYNNTLVLDAKDKYISEAMAGLYQAANSGRNVHVVNGVMFDGMDAPWGRVTYIWEDSDGDPSTPDKLVPHFYYEKFQRPHEGGGISGGNNAANNGYGTAQFVPNTPTILDVYGTLYNNGLIQSIDVIYVGHNKNDPPVAEIQQPSEDNDEGGRQVAGIKNGNPVDTEEDHDHKAHEELFALNMLYNDKRGIIADIGMINAANLTNLGKIIDIKTSINVAYDLENGGIIDGATKDDNGTDWHTDINVGGNFKSYMGSHILNVDQIDIVGKAELAGRFTDVHSMDAKGDILVHSIGVMNAAGTVFTPTTLGIRRIDAGGSFTILGSVGRLAVPGVPMDTTHNPAIPAIPAVPEIVGIQSNTVITAAGNIVIAANKEDPSDPARITSIGTLVSRGSVISNGKIENYGIVKNDGLMQAAKGFTNTGKPETYYDPYKDQDITLDCGQSGLYFDSKTGNPVTFTTGGLFINNGALFVGSGGFRNAGRFEGLHGSVYLQNSSPLNQFVNSGDGVITTGHTIHGDFLNDGGIIEVDMSGDKVSVLRVTGGTAEMSGKGKVRYIIDDKSTGAWSYLRQGDQYLFLETDTPQLKNNSPVEDPSDPANYNIFLKVNESTKLTYEGGVEEVFSLTPKYGMRVGDHYEESNVWRQYYWMEVSRKETYGDKGTTYNQRAVGEYLDTLGKEAITAPNDNNGIAGDFWNLLAKLDKVEKANVPRALDELSGAIYGSIGTTGVYNIGTVNQTMADVLRSDVFKFSHIGNPNNAFRSNPNYRGQMIAPLRWNRWATAFGNGGSSAFDGNASGYKQSYGGGIVGIDRAFWTGTRAGAYISGADGSVSLRDLNESIRSRDFLVGLYLRQEMQFGYTFATLGMGQNLYKTNRNLTTLQYSATNEHHGTTGTFYIERGADIPIYSWAIQPFAGFQVASIQQENFHERMNRLVDHNNFIDGRSVNTGLESDSLRTDSFRLSVGARTSSAPIPLTWGQAAVSMNLAWFHEFSNKHDRDAVMRITDAGGANYISATPHSFKVFGNEAKQDWINGGLGVHVDRTNTRVFFDVNVFANDRQTLFTGNGGFITSW